MPGTVLCVDPDDEGRATTATTLRDTTDRSVVECGDLAAALDALGPDVACVVSELRLPDGTGLDLLAELRDRAPDAGFVLFTDAEPDAVDTGVLGGAVAEYVPKGGPNARRRLANLVEHTVAFRTQTAYPLPDDEADRVSAIDAYRPVLGDAEPAFGRLTTLAGDLLGVPMAAVGIIDDHEEMFLACYGVDFGVLPREDTVCTYSLLEPGVTTIADLAEDPRFAHNEGIEASDLRAYASANITTAEGRVIGTFCAFDTVPREWTDEDCDHLELLAAESMESLELRRRLHEAEDATQPPEGERRTPAAGTGDTSGEESG
jgi:CheY-like chemotaxis protein